MKLSSLKKSCTVSHNDPMPINANLDCYSLLERIVIAKAMGLVSSCDSLHYDEIRIIDAVIACIEADDEYLPSQTMDSALRVIERKLSIFEMRMSGVSRVG